MHIVKTLLVGKVFIAAQQQGIMLGNKVKHRLRQPLRGLLFLGLATPLVVLGFFFLATFLFKVFLQVRVEALAKLQSGLAVSDAQEFKHQIVEVLPVFFIKFRQIRQLIEQRLLAPRHHGFFAKCTIRQKTFYRSVSQFFCGLQQALAKLV